MYLKAALDPLLSTSYDDAPQFNYHTVETKNMWRKLLVGKQKKTLDEAKITPEMVYSRANSEGLDAVANFFLLIEDSPERKWAFFNYDKSIQIQFNEGLKTIECLLEVIHSEQAENYRRSRYLYKLITDNNLVLFHRHIAHIGEQTNAIRRKEILKSKSCLAKMYIQDLISVNVVPDSSSARIDELAKLPVSEELIKMLEEELRKLILQVEQHVEMLQRRANQLVEQLRFREEKEAQEIGKEALIKMEKLNVHCRHNLDEYGSFVKDLGAKICKLDVKSYVYARDEIQRQEEYLLDIMKEYRVWVQQEQQKKFLLEQILLFNVRIQDTQKKSDLKQDLWDILEKLKKFLEEEKNTCMLILKKELIKRKKYAKDLIQKLSAQAEDYALTAELEKLMRETPYQAEIFIPQALLLIDKWNDYISQLTQQLQQRNVPADPVMVQAGGLLQALALSNTPSSRSSHPSKVSRSRSPSTSLKVLALPPPPSPVIRVESNTPTPSPKEAKKTDSRSPSPSPRASGLFSLLPPLPSSRKKGSRSPTPSPRTQECKSAFLQPRASESTKAQPKAFTFQQLQTPKAPETNSYR